MTHHAIIKEINFRDSLNTLRRDLDAHNSPFISAPCDAELFMNGKIAHSEAKGDKKQIALKAVIATCPTQLEKKSRETTSRTLQNSCATQIADDLIESKAGAISVNSFNYCPQ